MENISFFDLFGWSLWGIPFVSYPGELTDRLRGIGLLLTIVGLPAMVLQLNRPGFTGGQNSRRIAHHGTDIKEENLEAVFT